ncbi:protein CASC3-like isoform X3 [Diprion similis]|uniref:protein CASC3-like isoform X3 n=1 Tax=Diprion similis TaxID=362088 RepID=UPI001EF95946|nr:protein CASC3-like isoform X3 [Diprion similis]
MSDTRRRRKSHNSGGSEDLSDSYDELNVTKETQNNEVTEVEEHHDSEYETGESGSEADSQEGGLRESGDGQEEDKPQRKLDDDEDRRNPQYIPKRGTFYEHDDRTTEEVAEEKVETPNEREAKEKKVWKDKEDRWDHDRYNDDEQAPKSHDELVAVYGYDIRNEEGPPRARRRRRYGRGPNKYTRNWEDEDAYGKPGGPPSVGRGGTRKTNRSGEEFPALSGGNNKDDGSTTPEEPVISSAWYSNKNKSQPKAGNFPPLQPQHESPNSKPVPTNNSAPVNENKTPNEPTNPAWKKELTQNSHSQSPNRSGGGGDADKLMNHKSSPRDSNKRQVQESVSLAASRARGRGFKASGNTNNAGSNRLDYKAKGRGSGSVLLDNRRNNADNNHIDDHHLINDMKQMNVNDGGSFQQSNRQNKNFYAQSPGQVRPGTIPPRIQQQHQQPQQQQQLPQQQSARQQQHDAAGNRPKRYSSLRQRPPVPEGPGQQGYQPQHGQHGYYPQGYPPGHFEQAPPVATPAAPLAGQPVLPLPPGGQPASFAPPPFLVPSPQFLPPQGAPPSMINYVQGPNGPAFQPNFQGYQGFSPPVQPQGPPPPQELFQPQGCTYYSPAQQQQHAVPMRRPKAAIPILPPPDNQQHMTSRGRGRTTQQQSLPVPGGGMQRTNTEGKNNLAEGDGKFIQAQCAGNQIEKQIPTDHFAVNDTTEVGANCADNEDKDVISNSEMTNISETPNELKISLDVVVMKEQQQENEQEQEQQQEQEQPQEQQRVSESDDVITNKAAEQVTVNTTEPELPKIENKVIESPVVEEAAA